MSIRNPDAPAKSPDGHSRKDRRRVLAKRDGAKLARRAEANHAADDERHYAAMAKVIVAAMPDHAPGITVGSVFEAARRNTSRRQFPGDTHRMWARQVLGDLLAKGAVAASDASHLYLKVPRAS